MSNEQPKLPVEKGNYETTAPVFAKGLVSLLQPVVAECDERIQAVMYSQRELSKQLDMLSAELDRFMEVSRTPLIGSYIDKLLKAKERMIAINVLLGNIQLRLENLQRENNNLPTSKLPPITIPSASQPAEPKKTLLGVNQPQFLSSWISKAKAFVPDTPTTTTAPSQPAKTTTAPSAQDSTKGEKQEVPAKPQEQTLMEPEKTEEGEKPSNESGEAKKEADD